MTVRGIRGAITAAENKEEAILEAARSLLEAMAAANPGLAAEDIASAWFTTTPDLNAAYPAKAARQLGWQQVPLLCTQEIPVPGGLPLCVRVLLHWNTEKKQDEIKHVYLGGAVALRPDLAKKSN